MGTLAWTEQVVQPTKRYFYLLNVCGCFFNLSVLHLYFNSSWRG